MQTLKEPQNTYLQNKYLRVKLEYCCGKKIFFYFVEPLWQLMEQALRAVAPLNGQTNSTHGIKKKIKKG